MTDCKTQLGDVQLSVTPALCSMSAQVTEQDPVPWTMKNHTAIQGSQSLNYPLVSVS